MNKKTTVLVCTVVRDRHDRLSKGNRRTPRR